MKEKKEKYNTVTNNTRLLSRTTSSVGRIVNLTLIRLS